MQIKSSKVFYSFSVDDIEKAKKFYGETLELKVTQRPEGLELHLMGAAMPVFIYPSSDYHAPEHTVLNFIVDDIDKAVDDLVRRGIQIEHYDEPGIKTDSRGIMHTKAGEMGPKAIAWFKDPAGHILSVLSQ
jgi:catechol 2,3-dioxygenase-like lactoylglutathione lyase family enzyme